MATVLPSYSFEKCGDQTELLPIGVPTGAIVTLVAHQFQVTVNSLADRAHLVKSDPAEAQPNACYPRPLMLVF
jgi:hypothetical protein